MSDWLKRQIRLHMAAWYDMTHPVVWIRYRPPSIRIESPRRVDKVREEQA